MFVKENPDRKKNPFFGKFRLKNTKLYFLAENWHLWYLKDADSYSNISLLNFLPQNQFLGKFALKKLKLSVLSESWLIWYLEDVGSYSKISFLVF